jgi:putative phosphoesterase
MTRIGVLSDTHGTIDQPLLDFLSECTEVWHAGDLGKIEVMDDLAEGRIFRGVYGNIDDWEVRRSLPEFLEFQVEEVRVLITHIGFNYGRMLPEVVRRLVTFQPKVFVCGHSHILKVKNYPEYSMLHINPGGAGKSGLHQVRTAVRFEINDDRIENLDVWERQR